MKLPAGTYYVGDICYVVDNEKWVNFCEDMFPSETFTQLDGIFETGEGINYANFGTKYGDGKYYDQLGRSYVVDSGTIGCIPVCALGEFNEEEARRLGNIIDFPTSFEVEYDDESGLISLGSVSILTGDYPEDEEDEYDYNSEDEE